MRSILFALTALVLVANPAAAQPAPSQSVEAQLCRAQLELLVSGGKLTEDEKARFEAQCACLEGAATTGANQCSSSETL